MRCAVNPTKTTPCSDPRRCGGFSFIELTIVMTLLTIMVYAVTTLSVSGAQAQEYARRLTRVSEVTQTTIDDLRMELVSCVRIFGDDSEGNANLAYFDLGDGPAVIASSRLPTVSAGGSLQKDSSGNEITGNSVFFAKLAWSDRFTTSKGNTYLVDVLRWTYEYLSIEGDGPDPETPIGLNLVRAVSEPLVDAASIDRITDADDQAEVLLHLANGTPDDLGTSHDPCQVVWSRGDMPDVAGTFRQINEADGSLSTSPLIGRPDPWLILPASTPRGLLSYRHHSVATNFARGSFGVGRYGLRDDTGAGFPHGFEVQVVGPSAARQILLHLSCSSTNTRGQWAGSSNEVIVDARDL